nr:hypothetical protein [Tanacetum cinerariifolium]
ATESGEGDDEEAKSNGESKEEETREQEEESFDPIPRTPEDGKDDGNGEEDQGLRISEEEMMHEEEEADELYRDSSSISSFVTSLLNPIIDPGMESIFTTSSSTVTPIPSPKSTMTPSIITTTTTTSQPPVPPTPIPSDIFLTLPTFASVFRFEDRVKSLEVNFSNISDQGSKRRREGGEHASANTPSEPAIGSSGRSTTGTQSRQLSVSESAFAEEPVQTTCQMEEPSHPVLKQPLPLIPDNRGRRVILFEHFINNDLEYLRGGATSQKYTTSVTKTKATDYGHIKWIEDLVPRAMWIQEPINYDKESALDVYSKRRIIAITDLKIMEWNNWKLSNLTVEERFAFNVSLRMFTRSIVIQRRVEDLQLGVESYQKRLNLTKPDTYGSDLKRREAYTAYSNPSGFIY